MEDEVYKDNEENENQDEEPEYGDQIDSISTTLCPGYKYGNTTVRDLFCTSGLCILRQVCQTMQLG